MRPGPNKELESTPLVKQDMDAMECSNPHCVGEHPLVIHAKCHLNAGVIASYDAETGCINFYCKKCSNFVTRVLVKEATVQ